MLHNCICLCSIFVFVLHICICMCCIIVFVLQLTGQSIPVTVSNLVSSLQTPLPQSSFLSQVTNPEKYILVYFLFVYFVFVFLIFSKIMFWIPGADDDEPAPRDHPLLPHLPALPPLHALRASQHWASPNQPRQPGAWAWKVTWIIFFKMMMIARVKIVIR